MIIFIDDSGDAGFKIDKGSTRYFIIALVIFDDELEAEKTAVAIKELRRKLCFSDNAEFRFFKTANSIRKEFLQTVSPFRFRVRCVVIDKSIIRSDELKNDKNSFYSYAIKLVLQYSNSSIIDAKIRIDGSGDRIFRKNFISYLRRQLNSKDRCVVKNCKLIDSRGSVLIQLADMIAGSIHRSYNPEKKDDSYKKIVRKHIEDEWQFR
jgi:hypothetical protein